MNILILSAGTRNKIVQYFVKEINGTGNVIATDCSDLAPAIYEADKYYIVSRIDDNNYINEIIEICKKEKVDTLISLIDPELSLIAQNIEKFNEIGVKPIISDYSAIELAFDKYKMYQFLINNGFNTAKSYIDKDIFYKDLENKVISFPVFVKPVKGSASICINKVNTIEEIELLFSENDNLMIQEFMNGQELGVDTYIDMLSNEVTAIFIKEKIKMRAGETDKSKSIKNNEIFNLVTDFVKKSGFKGIIDIDIFEVQGKYYISEVNPRFGGGYPHAYESGVNIPKMIMTNIYGHTNECEIGNYDEDIYMMKYNEVKIVRK